MALATGTAIALGLAGAGLATNAIGMGATSKNRRAAEDYALQLSQEQSQRANELKAKLSATDRPEKTAMVDRLMSMYSGDLGITQEQKQLAQQNMARSSAQALRDTSSLGGGLRNIGMIQGQMADAAQNLAATDASMEQQQRLSIGEMLAQAEAEAEAYNKLLPYEQMLAEYQSQLGASQQNQMLAAQMKSDRAAQNAQMFSSIGGGLTSLGGAAFGV